MKRTVETVNQSRLRQLTDELQQLESRLRLGGGPDKVERQHQQGKLTARERIALLLDKDSYHQEIGLLVAYDQYGGGAPGAGVVTVVGRVEGREVVVVANDATVKAGIKLCGPLAWRDRPDFTCFQGGSETAAIARGVAAELGPLANTQAKPEVGPFAAPPKP